MTVIHDLRKITPRSNGTRTQDRIQFIARHHSGGSDGNFAQFWKFWNGTRGWGTGGYHEIILRDGSVELCYDPWEITNGVANHNTSIYHICVVGNGSFTMAQEKTFKERCLRALKLFGLPTSAVKGHNEFSGTSTACPGIDMDVVRRSLHTSATPVSTATVPLLDKGYLIKGDIGKDVGDLQRDLNTLSIVQPKLIIDNIFGGGVKAAVKQFQLHVGLVDDGIVGEKTLKALKIEMTKEVKEPVEKTTFSDVGKGHSAYTALERLHKQGILNGFPDGTYKPDETLTRGQFAIALNAALNGKG